MAFHDVLFPANVALGARGVIRRETDIVTGRSGKEHRNSAWANGRRVYIIAVPPDDPAAIAALIEHWEGRRGPLYSFPFKDFADWQSSRLDQTPGPTDQAIGTGDGSTTVFQLVKIYESAGPKSFTRNITKPITASVRIAFDGTEQTSGWSVDRLTGKVTFTTAPGSGVAITAGYQFHVPVRYESEELASEFLHDELASFPDVTLIEVDE